MRRFVREQSLSLVFFTRFLAALAGQALAGWHDFNNLEYEQPSLSWPGYLGAADCWQTTLQNRQSEFLAVGSMAVG